LHPDRCRLFHKGRFRVQLAADMAGDQSVPRSLPGKTIEPTSRGTDPNGSFQAVRF
jgi:hypothetical protein